MLLASGAAVADFIQCRDFPDGDFQSVQVDNGLLSQSFLSTLQFDENGQTGAICGAHLYRVSESGKFIRAFNYDSGPDYFTEAEGLARYVADDGLVGFVDIDLDIVIPAQFLCARPFQEGKALVSLLEDGTERNAVVYPDGRISFETPQYALCVSKP